MGKFWEWLSGKKRDFAHMYWAVVIPCVFIIWPENIPEAVQKGSACLGIFLTAIGFGHAAMKGAANVKK